MDARNWNTLIASFPQPHVLQTWEWGQAKSQFGWQPIYKTWPDEPDGRPPQAAALILQRTIPIAGFAARLRVMYVPRGPLLCDWGDSGLRERVLGDLKRLARRNGAIFIKIDPDVPLGTGVPGSEGAWEDPLGSTLAEELARGGWRFSQEQIQFRNTVLIDLTPSEEDLLARMKQKTRYNIRLAGRRGVSVRIACQNDFAMLYRMYAETSLRDGFVIREERYYRAVWEAFWPSAEGAERSQAPLVEPLIAEVEGEPVAGVVIFRFAHKAWYLYGMSLLAHREKMPNYLLQWEAMRRAKAAGCRLYDLWGAPDVFDESDSMWGVYRFKEGLGGQVVRHIGAWDLPVRPFYYRLYTRTLPRLLEFMRQRGVSRTRQRFST